MKWCHSPTLKQECTVYSDGNRLIIGNGPFEIRMTFPNDISAADINEFRSGRDGDLTTALTRMADGSETEGLVRELIRQGVIVEHPDHRRGPVDPEYLGHRLIDTFRRTTHRMWRSNPLISALRSSSDPGLSVGFLLESYFMVRNADWTAPTVLGHWLTRRQRTLLDEFFAEESDHGELMAGAFAEVGLDPDEIRAAHPIPETLSYNTYFFACGHQSPAHFATSLIIPGVPENPAKWDEAPVPTSSTC